jgi:hypothetical protein
MRTQRNLAFLAAAVVLVFLVGVVALRGDERETGNESKETKATATPKKVSSRWSGRTSPMLREELLHRLGGSAESEAAVARALGWLAEHQFEDGGWSFDHREGTCRGRCPDAGTAAEARNAATAMALLAFLGAGKTQLKGDHRKNVEDGLKFLLAAQSEDGSLMEARGTMYSHGLATIALCEAFGLTRDMNLVEPAQKALDFIVAAQDPVGGGWRYLPKQAGDTSVTGWQLLALDCGAAAQLTVPQRTLRAAETFLDAVASDDGARYGYTQPGVGMATSAIGLLCRLHLGWKPDNPSFVKGIALLSEQGPSKGPRSANMYYNFYATQVLRNVEGDAWRKWNEATRDWLIENQDRDGHAAGSWHQAGDHGAASGGRLYCTALATLLLESYYRDVPE